MKILVTGGTGVIGEGLIPKLRERRHAVRLLCHANEDAKRWEGVEPFAGDVADPISIAGAAAGCDAVVHIAGIVDATFEKINIEGTRNMLMEAERSSVRRFVFVSSPGVDIAAEALVARSLMNWTIVRPGNVYAPGVPVIDGDQEPIWYEDLGKILTAMIERNDLDRQILEAAGPLLSRFAKPVVQDSQREESRAS